MAEIPSWLRRCQTLSAEQADLSEFLARQIPNTKEERLASEAVRRPPESPLLTLAVLAAATVVKSLLVRAVRTVLQKDRHDEVEVRLVDRTWSAHARCPLQTCYQPCPSLVFVLNCVDVGEADWELVLQCAEVGAESVIFARMAMVWMQFRSVSAGEMG